jgi:hypothetical protein
MPTPTATLLNKWLFGSNKYVCPNKTTSPMPLACQPCLTLSALALGGKIMEKLFVTIGSEAVILTLRLMEYLTVASIALKVSRGCQECVKVLFTLPSTYDRLALDSCQPTDNCHFPPPVAPNPGTDPLEAGQPWPDAGRTIKTKRSGSSRNWILIDRKSNSPNTLQQG